MKRSHIALFALTVMVGLTGCGGEPQVSYREDVTPILKKHCLACHTAPEGDGYKASGLDMGSHATLMKGTKFGPIVVAGDAVSSTLNRLVEGKADPSIRMPHGGEPLKEAEITTLRLWVAQGASNN